MKIGLIYGSYKPFHKGHMETVLKASQENDLIMLFVSLADRKRISEFPILGKDMALLWKDHYESIMPANAKMLYTYESPIKKIYELLGKFEQNKITKDEIRIYGHEEIEKIFNNLNENVSISKAEKKHNITGTQMREFLYKKQRIDFIRNLPQELSLESKNRIFDLLLSNGKRTY